MPQELPAKAAATTAVIAPLILDFLEWLAPAPQPYSAVMEAWRTSCPHLTVWEDALDAGYVARKRVGPAFAMVEVTGRGRGLLIAAGRISAVHAGRLSKAASAA